MTSVTKTCRDLAELLPAAQTACRLLFQECYKAGIKNIFITETYRSQERQKYLYAQGRTRPGQIVTWTLDSNHKSRLAWDIAVGPPQSLYDVNTLNRVGALARKLGITWGGDWVGNIDRPHFEVKANWKLPAGYKLEGKLNVPTNSKGQVQLIVEDKDVNKEEIKMTNTLTLTAKEDLKTLLKKTYQKGILKVDHSEKVNSMTDGEVLGLLISVVKRTL